MNPLQLKQKKNSQVVRKNLDKSRSLLKFLKINADASVCNKDLDETESGEQEEGLRQQGDSFLARQSSNH